MVQLVAMETVTVYVDGTDQVGALVLIFVAFLCDSFVLIGGCSCK